MGSNEHKPRFNNPLLPTAGAHSGGVLSRAEFERLADVPPEVEWFANLKNENTRRAYRNDLTGFMRFAGIRVPIEFRTVSRAHVIAWRKDLERQKLARGIDSSETFGAVRPFRLSLRIKRCFT